MNNCDLEYFIDSAENNLLGAFLLDDSKFDEVGSVICGCHFTTQLKRDVFKAMQSLRDKKIPIDILNVLDELNISDEAQDKAARNYLFKIAKNVSFFANSVLLLKQCMLKRHGTTK